MKILIVLKNFNQRKGLPGGVGNANEELGKVMKKKGHKVDFLSREDDLKINSFLKSVFPLRKKIKELAKKNNYDIIYTQDWSLSFPLLFPYPLFRKKHFTCFCGHQENLFIVIQNIVGKMMGENLIVIGDGLKQRFPKAHLIYRGVNFEKFKPLRKKREGMGWVKKGTEKLVLSEKRLEKLSEKKGLKFYVAENIPSDKMNEFYNKCKVFISLPLKAGYNNSWNEAMAAGVPIIIGNYEGAGAMLPINKINMEKDVYLQIEKIIKNPKKINYREWLIKNGFSWENIAKKLLDTFSFSGN